MTNHTDDLLTTAREIAFADEDGLTDEEALAVAGWMLLDDLHAGGDQEDTIRTIADRLGDVPDAAALLTALDEELAVNLKLDSDSALVLLETLDETIDMRIDDLGDIADLTDEDTKQMADYIISLCATYDALASEMELDYNADSFRTALWAVTDR